MASLMKELKAEIARLARKEVKKEIVPVQRVSAARRSMIADLRRQVAALQRDVADLRRALSRGGALPLAVNPAAGADGEDGRKGFWITGKGVRKLRLRLGLTQTEFAQLANVSGQTVVNWEGTQGKIPLRRKDTAARLQEIRKMKKRDLKKKAVPAKAAK
ncbi:MAG TPA: helix-turn-helix domain-containing protein [Kiritimatiellia bacterium]|nr:helix-turn-helix domain-containing protein [Kiritimatiellia bacterium]